MCKRAALFCIFVVLMWFNHLNSVRQKRLGGLVLNCSRKGKQKQWFTVSYLEGSTPSLTTGYFGFIVNWLKPWNFFSWFFYLPLFDLGRKCLF
jgi:hypothetical protein